MQEQLRKNVRLAKALNDNEFTYKDFASVIDITENGFYNFLNGYYNLSYQKAKELEDFIVNLL